MNRLGTGRKGGREEEVKEGRKMDGWMDGRREGRKEGPGRKEGRQGERNFREGTEGRVTLTERPYRRPRGFCTNFKSNPPLQLQDEFSQPFQELIG
jgi:hypothetical protein